MTERQYGELGGWICPGCGDEVFRMLEGVCVRCNGKKVAREGHDMDLKQELQELRRQLLQSRRKR
jgi:hypothetical protein